MSVRIEAINGHQLALSGDLDTIVTLPAGAQDGRFSIAFSDGTLINGTHDGSAQNCAFEVQVEGASMVRVERDTGKDALVLDWRMEWIMVGPRAEIMSARDLHDCSEQLGFGFGKEMMRAA